MIHFSYGLYQNYQLKKQYDLSDERKIVLTLQGDFDETSDNELNDDESYFMQADSAKSYVTVDLLKKYVAEFSNSYTDKLKYIEATAIVDKLPFHMNFSIKDGLIIKSDEFEKEVELLRKYYPNVALTTDIIVGFPDETEEEFTQTYEYLNKIDFYKMHIFKYSPRKGTKAAQMKQQIDGANIKEERSRKLIELSDKKQKEHNEKYIGKNLEVLFEEKEGEYYKGHTTNYIVVKKKTDEQLENVIKSVHIIDENNLELIGE